MASCNTQDLLRLSEGLSGDVRRVIKRKETRESAIKFHYQLLWAELIPSCEKATVTLWFCTKFTALHSLAISATTIIRCSGMRSQRGLVLSACNAGRIAS